MTDWSAADPDEFAILVRGACLRVDVALVVIPVERGSAPDGVRLPPMVRVDWATQRVCWVSARPQHGAVQVEAVGWPKHRLVNAVSWQVHGKAYGWPDEVFRPHVTGECGPCDRCTSATLA